MSAENRQKYDQVIMETFSVDQAKLAENPAYSEIALWDSLGHMTMVAKLEEVFGINMETDDIINFGSYQKGLEILTKYGIEFP